MMKVMELACVKRHFYTACWIFGSPFFPAVPFFYFIIFAKKKKKKKKKKKHPRPTKSLLLNNVTPLRHVQTVKELFKQVSKSMAHDYIVHSFPHFSDILVPDSANLLNVGSTLGNTLEGVAENLKLILDVGRGDDFDPGLGSHSTDVLFTKEVSARIIQLAHDISSSLDSIQAYRISTSKSPVSLFFSMFTLIGK